MGKSNKKKIGIAVVILLIIFLASFFTIKTVIDSNKDKKEDTINNVIDKDQNAISDDNSSTKSQEISDKEGEEETFLIKFAYDNGVILQSTYVKKGELPVYIGPTPYIKGYKFIGWNRKIRVASEDTTYYAVFRKIETEEEEEEHYPYVPPITYTITVKVASDQESDCLSISGSGTYASGASVDISAYSKTDYKATVWDDNNTSNPRTVTVTSDKTYVASFIDGKKLIYLDSATGANETVLIKESESINVIFAHGTIGTESLTMNEDKNANELYSLKTTDDDWTFKGYVYNNQVSPKTLTATFVKKVEITASIGSTQSTWGIASTTSDIDDISRKPNNNKYDLGADVYVYAKPQKDEYDFVGWKEQGKTQIISTENPMKIIASKDISYVAVFENDHNYMFFNNIGENTGNISMNVVDGSQTIFKIKSESKGKKDDDLTIDDFEGGAGTLYKCEAPVVFLEYRIDKEINDNGIKYEYGFWQDFNNPEPTADLNDDDEFHTVAVAQDERICFRAKKVNGAYVNYHFCYMVDLPTEGETHVYYVSDGEGNFSPANSSLVAADIFKLNDSSFELNGSLMSLIDGRGSKHSTSVFTGDNDDKRLFTFGCLFLYANNLKNIVEKKIEDNVVVDGFVTPDEISIACYYSTFRGIGVDSLPSGLLPSKKMETACYAYAFAECKNLKIIPSGFLPANNDEGDDSCLAGRCYWNMFFGCIGLVNDNNQIPSDLLPSESLLKYTSKPDWMSQKDWENYILANQNCYRFMFAKCSNLQVSPDLPATILQPHCYEDMFNGCANLKDAPRLPAQTLAEYCYARMFKGCSSLISVEVGFDSFESLPLAATSDWLGRSDEEDIETGPEKNNGTFKWLGSESISPRNVSTVPSTWNIQPTTAVFIPLKTIVPESAIDTPKVVEDEVTYRYALHVDTVEDVITYSIYEYNEDCKTYELQEVSQFIDLPEINNYALDNYYFSFDSLLDSEDIMCEDTSSLFSSCEIIENAESL